MARNRPGLLRLSSLIELSSAFVCTCEDVGCGLDINILLIPIQDANIKNITGKTVL